MLRLLGPSCSDAGVGSSSSAIAIAALLPGLYSQSWGDLTHMLEPSSTCLTLPCASQAALLAFCWLVTPSHRYRSTFLFSLSLAHLPNSLWAGSHLCLSYEGMISSLCWSSHCQKRYGQSSFAPIYSGFNNFPLLQTGKAFPTDFAVCVWWNKHLLDQF